MTPPKWPEIGATFANGAYATSERIAGTSSRGRYRGVRTVDGAPVLIAVRSTLAPRSMVDRFRYEGPGVSSIVFAGPPDRDPGYVSPDRYEDLGAIELEPPGRTIESLAGSVSYDDMLRIGAGIAEVVEGAVQRKRVITGLRPELAYAARDDRGWRFTQLAPIAYGLLGHGYDDGGVSPFMPEAYVAPEFLDDEINQRADVFSLALVMWFLATGSHAYDQRPDQDTNIYLNHRRPWPGPEDIGRLLESALIYAHDQRASIDEFRAGLHAVARNRGVTLP